MKKIKSWKKKFFWGFILFSSIYVLIMIIAGLKSGINNSIVIDKDRGKTFSVENDLKGLEKYENNISLEGVDSFRFEGTYRVIFDSRRTNLDIYYNKKFYPDFSQSFSFRINGSIATFRNKNVDDVPNPAILIIIPGIQQKLINIYTEEITFIDFSYYKSIDYLNINNAGALNLKVANSELKEFDVASKFVCNLDISDCKIEKININAVLQLSGIIEIEEGDVTVRSAGLDNLKVSGNQINLKRTHSSLFKLFFDHDIYSSFDLSF